MRPPRFRTKDVSTCMRSPTAQGPFHTCQVHAWNDVAFSSTERDHHLGIRPVSQLNTQPMVSPVNASRLASRPELLAHHSGPEPLARLCSAVDFHLLSFASLSWRSPDLGHKEPVVVRKTRQLGTQKPPVRERNVTPAEVPPKAAGRGQAGRGHNQL